MPFRALTSEALGIGLLDELEAVASSYGGGASMVMVVGGVHSGRYS